MCAGYANLFVALARAAGLDAAYLTGNVRSEDGELAGTSHAWNAVRIDGYWALLNVTWDAGVVEDGRFVAKYRTAYLFTPPSVFRVNHLPEHDAWQLHPSPISRGAFIRQPNVTPSFHAAGLTLVSPDRAQVDAKDAVEVRLTNPQRRSILARLGGQRCTSGGGGQGASRRGGGGGAAVPRGDGTSSRCSRPAARPIPTGSSGGCWSTGCSPSPRRGRR